MLVSTSATDFFLVSVDFMDLVGAAENSTMVSSSVNLWKYAFVSRDTFDLSKDTDWMCEWGGHFPIMHPLDEKMGGGAIFTFWKLFSGQRRLSEAVSFSSVAVTQRQRTRAGAGVRLQTQWTYHDVLTFTGLPLCAMEEIKVMLHGDKTLGKNLLSCESLDFYITEKVNNLNPECV